MSRPVHVIWWAGMWRVRKDGAERATAVLKTKKRAVLMARAIAEGAVVIHREDGSVEAVL